MSQETSRQTPRSLSDRLSQAYGDNGLCALGFATASFFAQDFRKEFDFFPFLQITGAPATGKSSLVDVLGRLFRGHTEKLKVVFHTGAGLAREIKRYKKFPFLLADPLPHRHHPFSSLTDVSSLLCREGQVSIILTSNETDASLSKESCVLESRKTRSSASFEAASQALTELTEANDSLADSIRKTNRTLLREAYQEAYDELDKEVGSDLAKNYSFLYAGVRAISLILNISTDVEQRTLSYIQSLARKHEREESGFERTLYLDRSVS